MTKVSFSTAPCLSSVAILLWFSCATGHGLLTDPRQRGALRLDNHLVPTIDWDAPQDYAAHFPSGSKDREPGAGMASVKRAAGYNWTPYRPLDRNFPWRAGVCGDELGVMPQDHLRGGQYYHNAYRVREYAQGSIIFMESEIVAHHNGFFEFYICNIDTCGDDISERCFHEGHCRQLMRTPGSCDNGEDTRCGPIDPMYPGRWYLPCSVTEPMMMGGWSRTIAYTLPRDLVCDHCVIQWYWTGANTCNIRGIEEYFTGPHAPRTWGDCPGQGGAKGGWARDKPECGGERFPEEYWQCADIRIVPNPAFEAPASTPPPSSPSQSTPPFSFEPVDPVPDHPQDGDGGTMVVTSGGSTSQSSPFRGDEGDSLDEGQRGMGGEREEESSEQDETHSGGDSESPADEMDNSVNEEHDSEETVAEQVSENGMDGGSEASAENEDGNPAESTADKTEAMEESDNLVSDSEPSETDEQNAPAGGTSENESTDSSGSASGALGIHHSQV